MASPLVRKRAQPRRLANEPCVACSLDRLAHYYPGSVAYTGVMAAARRPLASSRKVSPVSSLTIRLAFTAMKVKNA